jgi:hypothetical protein
MKQFQVWVFCLLLLLQNGCASLASPDLAALLGNAFTNFGTTQTYNTARGGHNKILIIEPVQNLGDYAHVNFEPFQSGIRGNISPEFLQIVNEKVSEKIGESDFGKRGERTVVVKGEIIHIDRGTLSNSIVVRVNLSDGKTGESLGVANIEGREEGFNDIAEAASGVASGVVELLETPKGTSILSKLGLYK